ncbi:MAG: hypothetical protein ACR2KX_06040 [Chitinophagaceae bacterium]
MPQSRQLAAIMFTDIVGYTALMGNDEDKAFDMLNKTASYKNHSLNNMVADGSRSWGMVYWQVFVQPLILFSVLPKFKKPVNRLMV